MYCKKLPPFEFTYNTYACYAFFYANFCLRFLFSSFFQRWVVRFFVFLRPFFTPRSQTLKTKTLDLWTNEYWYIGEVCPWSQFCGQFLWYDEVFSTRVADITGLPPYSVLCKNVDFCNGCDCHVYESDTSRLDYYCSENSFVYMYVYCVAKNPFNNRFSLTVSCTMQGLLLNHVTKWDWGLTWDIIIEKYWTATVLSARHTPDSSPRQ